MAIKQIKDSAGVVHNIDAPLWCGKTFSEVESLIHGVVDTYVIAAQTSGTTDYKAVVESSAAQCSTTASALNTLTSSASTNTYKVGDIILMGATSDGKKNFDRWVSKISGTTVYLDVLETQVATHTHNVTSGSAKALTGANTPTTTTANVAKVGTAVSVVTSGTGTVVTGVAYSGSGSHSLKIESVSSGGVGHSHTVNSHTHSITLGQSALVSQKANAFTTLISTSLAQHSHGSNVAVAATPSAAGLILSLDNNVCVDTSVTLNAGLVIVPVRLYCFVSVPGALLVDVNALSVIKFLTTSVVVPLVTTVTAVPSVFEPATVTLLPCLCGV